MKFTIKIGKDALDVLSALPDKIQKQISKKIDTLANDPRSKKTLPLRSDPSKRRIRSGNYRVIYEVHDKEVLVLVVYIGDRKDVYKAFDRK